MKKTLVLGASTNPERYSYMAIRKLRYAGYPVVAVGLREGEVCGVRIEKGFPNFDGIDTVTLYVGPKNLRLFYDYILSLHPRRVLFNPGTESAEFETILREAGIVTEYGCTLVMVSNNLY
jgi:predicted CoA-binding protein